MNIYLFLLFFTFQSQSKSTDDATKNYFQYHEWVNKAEALYFFENKIDSSLYYYDKTFEAFEAFIFVKDLLNAAQIAKFNKKEYKHYIEKSFKYGLKLENLSSVPLLKEDIKQYQDSEIYRLSRSEHVQKLDVAYLDYIQKLAVEDQFRKYDKNTYRHYLRDRRFQLRKKIFEKGFPSDRVIGLNDDSIFKELGLQDNYSEMTVKSKRNKKGFAFHEIEERIFGNEYIIPFILHLGCPTDLLSHKEYLAEIKKGNLHPRDLALIYDTSLQLPYSCTLNNGHYYTKQHDFNGDLNVEEANKLRKELYMVSYELDLKKKAYEKENNFRLFYGHYHYR